MVDEQNRETKNPPCPKCNRDDVEIIVDYQAGNFRDEKIFEDLKIAFCGRCGFGEVFPHVEDERLKKFYIRQYRSQSSSFYIKRSRSQPSADLRSLAQISLGRLFSNNIRTFLDLGPGAGGSFAAAQKLIKPEKMYALELNAGAANQFSNFGVQTIVSMTDIINIKQLVDFTLASHFLEHLSYKNLERLLFDLRKIMAQDGVFVVEVPHVDMSLHLDSRPIDCPHLLFFSLESLKDIFSSNGWQVLFANTCGPIYSPTPGIEKRNNTTRFMDELKSGVFKFAYPSFVKQAIRSYRFMLSDQNECGGNRQCIRLVAKKVP